MSFFSKLVLASLPRRSRFALSKVSIRIVRELVYAHEIQKRLVGNATGFGAFIGLTWLERRRPLRHEVELNSAEERGISRWRVSGPSLQLAGAPPMRRLTHQVDRIGWGLRPRIPAPRWLKVATALLIMDYTFYVW